MEIKLTVRAEIIAALKLFAADKDVRYYMNGINLEIGATESRLVATNGHILGVFRIEGEQPEIDTPLRDIIIPTDLLKPIKAKGEVEITIGPLETSFVRQVTLSYAGVSMSGKTLDGKFPDYRRVIPSKVTGEPAQFNLAIMGTLAKAYTALHGGKGYPLVAIGYNGTNGALIDLADENFIGVIMPMRTGAVVVPKAPNCWFADSLRVATDSAADLV